jgi:phosphatidylinositol alpha-1,6-mannosyltransferase
MVGDGPYKEYLEHFSFNQLNLKANVTFAGAMSDKDIADCYYECDLFAMISRQFNNNIEGFGIAFLEAGYAKKVVVVVNSGGIPDAVEHNKIGVLVNPNDLDKTSGAIIDLLQNKSKRIGSGKNRRKLMLNSFT